MWMTNKAKPIKLKGKWTQWLIEIAISVNGLAYLHAKIQRFRGKHNSHGESIDVPFIRETRSMCVCVSGAKIFKQTLQKIWQFSHFVRFDYFIGTSFYRINIFIQQFLIQFHSFVGSLVCAFGHFTEPRYAVMISSMRLWFVQGICKIQSFRRYVLNQLKKCSAL